MEQTIVGSIFRPIDFLDHYTARGVEQNRGPFLLCKILS